MYTATEQALASYLLMQIPSNLFLNKLGKPALYLPTCVSAAALPYPHSRRRTPDQST